MLAVGNAPLKVKVPIDSSGNILATGEGTAAGQKNVSLVDFNVPLLIANNSDNTASNRVRSFAQWLIGTFNISSAGAVELAPKITGV